MPIDKEEFENGKLHQRVEDEIVSFLKERKERAFTSQEIMGGIHHPTEFSTPEIAKMSTFAIADFTALLYELVKMGKIKMRVIRSRMYFTARVGVARCPKCGVEVDEPKKTWNMTGRPNRKGIRTQLRIGLFQCPRDGFFRIALGKKKIPSLASPKGGKRTKKRLPKKRISKRKIKKKTAKARQKRKPKKSSPWPLL